MPKSLADLGLDQSAVPIFRRVLDSQRELQKLKNIQAKSQAEKPETQESLIPERIGGVGIAAKPEVRAKKSAAKSNAYHVVRRLLDEQAWYPEHDKRQSSPEYRKAHEKLVAASGCLICGVTKDILDNESKRENLKLNPYGAKQLETHHHVIEWALANAIDSEKFNRLVLPHLKARHSNNPQYTKPFTREEISAWVDHSEDNLWVLCDVHHRAKWFGIHEITDPIWGPQDIFDDDYLAHVRAAIAKTSGKKATKTTAKAKSKKSKGRA